MRMLVAAAEAQTSYYHVIKLCFLSSCFEYQDLFVGSRITYPSESYLSWKVMSEVSLGSVGLAAYVYSYSSAGFCYRYSREGTEIVLAEKFSSIRTCSVSRIAYPSMSYLSWKVMSEVSVSWRRRSPSTRSALPLTRTLVVFRIPLSKESKSARDVLAERLFPRKILTQRRETHVSAWRRPQAPDHRG
jgi:hypothetical protein